MIFQNKNYLVFLVPAKAGIHVIVTTDTGFPLT